MTENVRKMNAEALNLSEHSEAVQEAALSTYKLTEYVLYLSIKIKFLQKFKSKCFFTGAKRFR